MAESGSDSCYEAGLWDTKTLHQKPDKLQYCCPSNPGFLVLILFWKIYIIDYGAYLQPLDSQQYSLLLFPPALGCCTRDGRDIELLRMVS